LTLKDSLIVIVLILFLVALAGTTQAQEAPRPAGMDPLALAPTERELVRVDWFEEMGEGGVTMIALAAVSIALLAFVGERAVTLRQNKIVPPGLLGQLLPLFHQRRYDQVRKLAKDKPSALAHTAAFLVEHRKADPQILMAAAGDLGAREIVKQEQRCQPFALIAGIAPLLGLLGTMIGMIESFKLVEVFGDEGGASLLAGSISKALITTAVGLILAIPALVAYHFFKHRAHMIGTELEEATEQLFNAWFLTSRTHEKSKTSSPSTPARSARPEAKAGMHSNVEDEPKSAQSPPSPAAATTETESI